MPDAKAMELAAIPATSRLPAPMTDSEGETTVCERPLQWRLGPNVQPSPADMIKFLNVAVPWIYTMNHTGVALASQTLGCTAVPDEFMDYCALQRLLLIRAAPQSLPFAQKSALLASVLQPLAGDFDTEPLPHMRAGRTPS